MPNQYTPLNERFWANVEKTVRNNGCWIWKGATSISYRDTHRPIMNKDGKPTLSYRVAYELFVGPIPKVAMICHHCDNPMCVNPKHLYAGDAKSNAKDSVSRGRHTAQKNPEAAKKRAYEIGKRNTWTKNRVGKSIIPHSDIPKILARKAKGEGFRAIAKDYKVSGTALMMFLRRAKQRAALALASGTQEEIK